MLQLSISKLVGGIPTSEKYEFASWLTMNIQPNIWRNIQMFQSPATSELRIVLGGPKNQKAIWIHLVSSNMIGIVQPCS